MTNLQIITDTAIAQGLYTEAEAKAFFDSGNTLPLHTYKEWASRGYQVRKGEHAAMVCDIWRLKNKKATRPMQDGEDKEIDESHFFKHKAFFFTDKQVERIAE